MAESDDIEKLLREIDAMNAGGSKGAATPAVPAGASVAQPAGAAGAESGGGGRVAWAGASAAGGLVVGGLVGTVLTLLPYVSTASTALGAALGAGVAGLVSGPPDWFHRG